MEYPIEVTLQRPVTVDGTAIGKLVFDEPDLATMIAVEEESTTARQTIALLAGMAGVDRSVILRVKGRDYAEIRRLVLEPYQASLVDDGASGNGEAA